MIARRLTPITFLATLLGVGFIPVAPGTFGTLFAAGVYLLLPSSLFGGQGWWWLGGGLLLVSAAAVWISGRAEKTLGHDAPAIVIDEFCGYFVAVLLLPKSPLLALYAFVLFRVFDIAKPFPINLSQRLRGGWGIVIDDLIAGVYANLVIQLIKILKPSFFGS
ncbi:MAG: phosphatidylglycerophosphatase A [Candidatus Cloacimonetes bacterium]|jgi:phosphatidylglycerophosphatase A|nr:phosphatidylglycerophosphatase A [Candidatus Cloacimonadota bacterium]HOY85008.1 phosphatidylglycerophosphatase A [Candidatus Syntrophosphaera sp.]HPH60137.1 phosphatidylglycerophosphatase A [Candidatus Syntrophosphaera sp.]